MVYHAVIPRQCKHSTLHSRISPFFGLEWPCTYIHTDIQTSNSSCRYRTPTPSMISPEQVAEMLYPATHTKGPGPIPTVVPTPTHYDLSTTTGHRTLWVLFAAMTLSTALFALLSWNVPTSRRLFHITTTLLTLISALAYFAAATGAGSTLTCLPVRDHHNKHGIPDTYHRECRQVFWAHYVDWALTTPVLLVNLALVAGVDGAHTLLAVVAGEVSVLAGLFATLHGTAHYHHHDGKDGSGASAGASAAAGAVWGWFVIAALGYLFAVWHIGLHGTKSVQAKGQRVARLWASLAIYTLTLLAAYPIVWAIAPLARKTSVDVEIIIYAVLDILAKPVFGLWLLGSIRSIAEANIDVGGYWSQGPSAEGRIRIGEED
ncbi:hypothetical protein B0J18DRAFT_438599 [Chaetomium sp. MPI-SDFR-AT-0129]|nr:hypothetical protein B0J18DRAFT_438599 [Chaetomium sp. MPI-SDFR-AT-0129]